MSRSSNTCANYPKIIDVHEIDSLEIYPTDRPDTVIGEWSVKGHVIPNGNAYNMSYATFVTVRDGSIVNYREYWNPLALAQALGTCRSSRKMRQRREWAVASNVEIACTPRTPRG